MYCPTCGELLSVHLLATPASPQAHYCRSCKKQIRRGRSLVCPNCSLSYEAFKNKGLVGCGACYLAFAPRLEPLMRDYQKRTPGLRPGIHPPIRSSLSVARSQELREALWGQTRENVAQSRADLLSFFPDRPSSKAAAFGPKKKAQEQSLTEQAMPDSVLSLRLRVARNISGVPFYDQLSLREQELLRGLLLSRGSPIPSHLHKHGFGFPEDCFDQKLQVYTGDEDHLRISWQGHAPKTSSLLASGSALDRLCKVLNTILTNLEGLVSLYDTAWQQDYGYLTACPALAGAGIRFSVELSLPGLAAKSGDWLSGLSESGFEIRSPNQERFCYTERAQISLRSWPYGEPSLPLIERLLKFTLRLIEWERKVGTQTQIHPPKTTSFFSTKSQESSL